MKAPQVQFRSIQPKGVIQNTPIKTPGTPPPNVPIPAPVIAPTTGTEEKGPLQRLQEADVYFSSQSSRARIDRLLDAPDEKTLLFHFKKETTTPVPLPPGATSTLILLKEIPQNLAAPAKTDKTTESTAAGQTLAVTAGNAPEKNLRLQWVHYEPVTDATLMIQAQGLEFPPASPQDFPGEKRVAYIPKSGVLIAQPRIQTVQEKGMPETVQAEPVKSILIPQAQTILEKTRPWALKVHTFLRQLLPAGQLGPIKLGEDGSISFLDRWSVNPVRYWQDSQGNPVKFFNLAKLPGGMLVHVKEKQAIGSFSIGDGAMRKAMKERILLEIEQLEKQGYTLMPEALLPQRPTAPLPGGFAMQPSTQALSKVGKSGTYTTNPFAVQPAKPFTPKTVPAERPTKTV